MHSPCYAASIYRWSGLTAELTAAREATFGEPLSNENLGKPPSTGPNAFYEEERNWCEPEYTRREGGASRAASRRHRTLRRAREVGEAAAGDRRASSRRELGKEAPVGGSPARLTECQCCHPISRSAVRIIRTQGCKLALTVLAFEVQPSFGLLALLLISFLLKRIHPC